jgi:hypothetical protein
VTLLSLLIMATSLAVLSCKSEKPKTLRARIPVVQPSDFRTDVLLPVYLTHPRAEDFAWSGGHLTIRQIEARTLVDLGPQSCRIELQFFVDHEPRPYVLKVPKAVINKSKIIGGQRLAMPTAPSWLTTKILAACNGNDLALVREFDTHFPKKTRLAIKSCEEDEPIFSPRWLAGRCIAHRAMTMHELRRVVAPYCQKKVKNKRECV